MNEHLHSFTKLEFDKVKAHLLKYVLSDLGKEHVEDLQPTSSIELINSQLSLVSEMKLLLEGVGYPPLDQLYDCRISLQRTTIENFVLPADELHRISGILDTSKKIYTFFARIKSAQPLLYQKIQSLYLNKILEYNINQAIDEHGNVKDSATKELASLRRQIGDKNDALRSRLESILKSVGEKDWLQEDIITTREGRMVIPVKSEFKKNVQGFIHSSSSSGATVFIEPTETLELNNDIRTLQFQERREVERILKSLTDQVRDCKEQLLANVEILGELDFIQAKAKYSIAILGNQPLLKASGALKLLNARHPLLFQRHHYDKIVPLTLEVGGEVKTIIITGPNAGGKSVALKTVGLLCLMAQAGCHIPTSVESEVPVYTDMFIDIGDEQSIENDLSSFSSHLKNMNDLLEHATPQSLILVDEIGSGTDPVEGAAISASIIAQLTSLGCTTIATTHHGSLKVFAYETPGIENAAMEFDQETLEPTYRFRYGVPGSSYALEMAERMSLPQEVISRAKQFLGEKSYNLEQLIAELERHSQQLTTELQETTAEKQRLESLRIQYQEKIKSLEKEIKQIKSQAITEAQDIVNKAHSTVERVIKDIKEREAEKTVVKAVRQEINELAKEYKVIEDDLQPEYIAENELTIGSIVRLKNSNSTGEIIEVIDSNHFLVLIGDLKVKANKRELRIAQQKKLVSHPSTQVQERRELKQEIDLRGMFGDEAVEAMDKFLDNAILNGLHRVDIIHGKGTGVLRKRIAEYLKNDRRVKSHRLGEWNEGGAGMTVAELQ